tara:strand:- start:964 stop:2826 length:1863 start_codon:yes stop_codon:yes gene_type:complete
VKPHFERTNANGTRAQCIECGEGKKSFSVAVYDDHAYCHRCNKHWNFVEKKVPEAIVIKNPPKPVYVKSDKASKEAKYDEARNNFLQYFKIITQELQLPWPEKATEEEYGIGALNKNETVQLVFKIRDNHYKYHKGQQFGDAGCTIYPKSVLPQLQDSSTLLICEGEKDAITANANGAPAITFTSGAGALPQDISELEKFTNLVICYDNDDTGKDGASKVAKQLYKQNRKRKIKVLQWNNKPEKHDLTDFFIDGYNISDLYALIDKLPVYGANPSDFGGMDEYAPDDFVSKLNREVVQICEEILLENGTSSISGQSNVGKSILALQFAMSVAMGVPFLTFRVPRPRRVLFVQFEMVDQMVAQRIEKLKKTMLVDYPTMESNYQKNLRITSVANIKIFTDQYEAIEGNLMAADPPFDVVVIDNIYTSGAANIAKNDELTQLMSRIDTLRKEYKCAWLLVSHHKKLEEKRPLEHGMVYGGSYFVNFLDNLIQVANTGRHKLLKVFKITKIRTENQFHEIPLGILLKAEDDQLYFEYKKPLPKNELYWYTEPDESQEEKLLNYFETPNFTYKDMANALAEVMKITSSRSVYKWLDKLIAMGYIMKIEKNHYAKCPNELDAFIC